MNTTTQPKKPDAPHVTLPVDLRDYFAAKAMQALVANRCYPWDREAPLIAYGIADAMLKAREA